MIKLLLLLLYWIGFGIVLFAVSFSFAIHDYNNALLIICSLGVLFLGLHLRKKNKK